MGTPRVQGAHKETVRAPGDRQRTHIQHNWLSVVAQEKGVGPWSFGKELPPNLWVSVKTRVVINTCGVFR